MATAGGMWALLTYCYICVTVETEEDRSFDEESHSIWVMRDEAEEGGHEATTEDTFNIVLIV